MDPNPSQQVPELPKLDFDANKLAKQAKYKRHPYGETHKEHAPDMFKQLCADMDRRGLDKPIILYQDMILDGWHRYLACLASRVTPKFEDFRGDDLAAAELVHASELRRHKTPEQRAASFVLLCNACPSFRQKFEELAETAKQQQKGGKPLAIGSQRVNVSEAKAQAAGVSDATMKKAERLAKENPDALNDVATGKATTNKELEKLKKKRKVVIEKAKKQNGQKTENTPPKWQIVVFEHNSDNLKEYNKGLRNPVISEHNNQIKVGVPLMDIATTLAQLGKLLQTLYTAKPKHPVRLTVALGKKEDK